MYLFYVNKYSDIWMRNHDMNEKSWFQQWNSLPFAVEQNPDNDITLDGMTINKEGAFGPCILWEVEIQWGWCSQERIWYPFVLYV